MWLFIHEFVHELNFDVLCVGLPKNNNGIIGVTFMLYYNCLQYTLNEIILIKRLSVTANL